MDIPLACLRNVTSELQKTHFLTVGRQLQKKQQNLTLKAVFLHTTGTGLLILSAKVAYFKKY